MSCACVRISLTSEITDSLTALQYLHLCTLSCCVFTLTASSFVERFALRPAVSSCFKIVVTFDVFYHKSTSNFTYCNLEFQKFSRGRNPRTPIPQGAASNAAVGRERLTQEREGKGVRVKGMEGKEGTRNTRKGKKEKREGPPSEMSGPSSCGDLAPAL